MPDPGVLFSVDAANRIRVTVRTVEARRIGEGGGPGIGGPRPGTVIVARITGVDPGTGWHYAWEQVAFADGDTYETDDDALSGTAEDDPAIELNEREGIAVDTRIVLVRMPWWDTTEDVVKMAWAFSHGGLVLTGEYVRMSLQTVAQNTNGFDFERLHPMIL